MAMDDKQNDMFMGAKFSPCRLYRYLLWRKWNFNDRMCAFIGVNPSTADEVKNDPTVTRCQNYAKAWGFSGIYMLNVFAYRATDPKKMKARGEPVGVENDSFIRSIVTKEKTKMVVACWGLNGMHRNRHDDVYNVLKYTGRMIYCLDLTKDNIPKHPLYLKADLKPKIYIMGRV